MGLKANGERVAVSTWHEFAPDAQSIENDLAAAPYRRVKALVGFGVFLWVMSSAFAATGQDDTSTTAPEGETTTSQAPETTAQATTTLSAEERQKRDQAVANLNLAKANDRQVAAQLQATNEQANATIEKIEAATKRIRAAELIANRTAEDLRQSSGRQSDIEQSLKNQAVEGFKKSELEKTPPLFTNENVNNSLRQGQLLDQASASTTELLQELRGILAARQVANAEAAQAKSDAEKAERELQAELETLKDQQGEQLALKAEAERRIDNWESDLTAYAAEDDAIQDLIGKNAEPAPVTTGISNPTAPSLQGFQWPVEGRVTSEYGYRTHPVYGTRKLHAGIDVGAAGGTQITAAKDGTVIFAATRGGYGRTVIVDHGGGVTTLYAHMRDYGTSEGATVRRGDVLGFVGQSGTATGNHLHFEVRVNGSATNPRAYLG